MGANATAPARPSAPRGGTKLAEVVELLQRGTVLGQPIEILTADHQNKPDIAVQKFREWADTDGLTMQLGGSNTGVSLALSSADKEKKVPFFAIGAAGASLTGKDCTPYTIHYGYDTTALANGTAKTILEQGGKSWFFLTADYAFGTQLENGAASVVKANGGTVVGDVRVPLGTSDFASYLLQAQGSGAQVLGLANAGTDTSNSLKASAEFGLTKTMKPAALLVFITDVHAMGLDIAQGLVLTTAWYWDLDDRTRAFSKRFFDKVKKEPTFPQAAFIAGPCRSVWSTRTSLQCIYVPRGQTTATTRRGPAFCIRSFSRAAGLGHRLSGSYMKQTRLSTFGALA